MYTTQKFSLIGRESIPGCRGAIYESFNTAEMVAALAAGTGPGVRDSDLVMTPGTIVPGHIVELDSSGNATLATSPDLSAALPKMMWLVVTGNNDWAGMDAQKINCAHGGLRARTEKFDAAQTYTVGLPLIVSAGILTPKVLGDHKQVVGYVGPGTVDSGVLDFFMVQGAIGA